MANALPPLERKPRAVVETFVLLLAPFAPHLAEELWSILGHEVARLRSRGRVSTRCWLRTNVESMPSRSTESSATR